MRSRIANVFLEKEKHCDGGAESVYLREAEKAVEIAEDEFMAKVADAWDAMSEAMRFDITTDAMIKAKDVFIEKLMKDE